MKSLMLLLSIHSDTNANLCASNVAQSNGRIFGCLRCLQATASLQNLYELLGQSRFLAGCMGWGTNTQVKVAIPGFAESGDLDCD